MRHGADQSDGGLHPLLPLRASKERGISTNDEAVDSILRGNYVMFIIGLRLPWFQIRCECTPIGAGSLIRSLNQSQDVMRLILVSYLNPILGKVCFEG